MPLITLPKATGAASEIKMGTKVYWAWHCYEYEEGQYDDKLLGIYSTPEKAESAIVFLRDKPGFRDYPNGFDIR